MPNALKTNHLVIRPFKTIDLLEVHSYASSPNTTKYMLWGPNTLDETKQFLNQAINNYEKEPITNYEYGIEYQGKIIGGVGIFIDYSNMSAEIGWILNENYHRQGFMFEAATEMIKLAKNLGVESIHATADSRNVPSHKLMEKLGMKHIKTSYKSRYHKETKQSDLDEVYYEIYL